MPQEWTAILGDLLISLKFDLGILTDAYNERLLQYLSSSYLSITRMGAKLDAADISHRNIVAQYAAWLWRRRDTGERMPRMVQYEIHNIIFSQKMRGEDG